MDAVSNLVRGQNILSLLRFLRLTAFLWPPQAVVEDGGSYDFVIVGGGTAGCVIASRLVELNVSVLLVEAGGEPPIEAVFPGMFPFMIRSKMDWNFTSYGTPAQKNEEVTVKYIQQGKLLGGSAQVGFMIHANGFPDDYDKWAEITNDSTWEYENLTHLIKKIEAVYDKKIRNSPDIVFHGTEGKIKMTKTYPESNDLYFEAYRELGLKTLLDLNPNNTVGYTNCYFNIDSKLRQSTANSYMTHVKNNLKLSVLYNALVTKIIFDDKKRAVGVEICTKNSNTITVKAAKEIIVTAGAIKSAQLLMLSGIGPTAHLKTKNIKSVADLPVGQNLQEHPCVVMTYKMGLEMPLNDPSPFDFPVTAMIGSIAVNEKQRRPDYQVLSGNLYQSSLFLQACLLIYGFDLSICDSIAQSATGRQLYVANLCLLYPKSRGEVLLNNTNPKENPIVKPRTYFNETDLDDHVQYLLHYIRVLNTKAFKRVNAEFIHVNIEKCQNLKKGTVEYWKCYIINMATTLYMYVGTNAMGSVVDSNLQVIGVKKLRVADASVIPNSVGAPTQASTIIIAEKLVEILKKAYKVSFESNI